MLLPRLTKISAWPTVSGSNNTHLLEVSLILRIVVSVQHVNLDIVNNYIGKSDAPINQVIPPGGVLGIYIGGGVPWHTKKGGVLGAGTAQKGGS